MPWLDLLCDLFQYELVPGFGADCWIGYERSEVVPDDGDLKLRAVAVSPSAFRVRDLRAAGGFVPDPERGDEVLTAAGAQSTPTQLPGGNAPSESPEMTEAFERVATEPGKSSS